MPDMPEAAMKYVVTADLHLRNDVPLCRKETQEEWMKAQSEVLAFIATTANDIGADVIDVGDNFNTPRVQDEVKSLYLQFAKECNGHLHTIPANHTLPYHQKKNINESSIGVMRAVDNLHTNLHVYDCDEMSDEGRFEHSYWLTEDIVLCHTLTYPSEDDVPFFTKGISAFKLLHKYKKAKWIFTGDNHHHFHVEDDGKHLINPGTPIIQVADMMEYVPGIYIVDTDKETVEWVEVPNDPTMLTDNHLQDKVERNERISAFVEILEKSRSGGRTNLSFEDNLRRACELDGVDEEVKDIIEELLNKGVEA